MKKLPSKKNAVVILGIISILVLVYVSAGMPSLQFQEGKPFSVAGKDGGQAVALGRFEFPMYYMILLAVGLLAIMTIFALIVMPPKKRLILLALLVLTIIGFFVIGYLSSQPQAELEPTPTPMVTGTPMEVVGDEGTPEPTIIPSEFTPPKVSSWTSYLVALVLTAVVAVGAWFFLSRIIPDETPDLKELRDIALAAIDDLQEGKDWGNTIEGCYYRMTDTIQKRRGLKRHIHITPAEFAVILEKTGLPGPSIRRLTALFERVRYGGKKSTKKDVDEAVACMTEIVDACREAEQ